MAYEVEGGWLIVIKLDVGCWMLDGICFVLKNVNYVVLIDCWSTFISFLYERKENKWKNQ